MDGRKDRMSNFLSALVKCGVQFFISVTGTGVSTWWSFCFQESRCYLSRYDVSPEAHIEVGNVVEQVIEIADQK